ncbi:MAG: KdsC family phosphatase [Nitrospinota bacterium]
MLIMDVDGVLTDGQMIFTNQGDELKSFDVKDGTGITLAHRAGLLTAILTGKCSQIVTRRAEQLGISYCRQDLRDKLEAYEAMKKEKGLSDEEIAYIGDDLIDIPAMRRAGLAVAVADAVEEVKAEAHLITRRSGGKGAVRETVEFILKAQGRWEGLLNKFYGI